MGLPLLVLAALSERSGSTGASKLLGLLALGTALGNLALTLHCPIVIPGHLWLGHVTVAVPLLVASLVAVRGTRNRKSNVATGR